MSGVHPQADPAASARHTLAMPDAIEALAAALTAEVARIHRIEETLLGTARLAAADSRLVIGLQEMDVLAQTLADLAAAARAIAAAAAAPREAAERAVRVDVGGHLRLAATRARFSPGPGAEAAATPPAGGEYMPL